MDALKRTSTQHSDKAKQLFSGAADAAVETGRTQRRRAAMSLRKEARDRLISAKRRRAMPVDAAAAAVAAAGGGGGVDLSALQAAAQPDDQLRLRTLQALRKHPQMAALPQLVALAQQGVGDAAEQATWCISALLHDAEADADVDAIIASGAVQVLVARAPTSLAAVWSLANLAAHGASARLAARQHGAVDALDAAAASAAPNGAAAGEWQRATAWALCQVVRGPNDAEQLGELMRSAAPALAVKGAVAAAEAVAASGDAAEGAHADATAVLAEYLWTCAYLTAASADAAHALVQLGLLPALTTALTTLDQRRPPPPPTAAAAAADARLAALRCTGNLFSCDDALAEEMLRQGGRQVVAALGRCIVDEPLNSALCREATWALSNLCGGRREHAEAVVDAGLLDALVRVFAAAPFAEQVEAGFALLNLARLPNLLLRVWSGGSIMPPMLGLMRAHDGEAIELALRFVEHMLEHGPRDDVVRCVQEHDGLAALEDLRMVRPDLAPRANRLIDMYIDPLDEPLQHTDDSPHPLRLQQQQQQQHEEYPPWRVGAHDMRD